MGSVGVVGPVGAGSVGVGSPGPVVGSLGVGSLGAGSDGAGSEGGDSLGAGFVGSGLRAGVDRGGSWLSGCRRGSRTVCVGPGAVTDRVASRSVADLLHV